MGDEPDPIEIAAEYHRVYGGKLATRSTVPLREDDLEYDLLLWYTPGVAEPCKAIDLDEQQVYEYTSKKNMIAVVSDGTRVLGLEDIGPHAGLPVMEG